MHTSPMFKDGKIENPGPLIKGVGDYARIFKKQRRWALNGDKQNSEIADLYICLSGSPYIEFRNLENVIFTIEASKIAVSQENGKFKISFSGLNSHGVIEEI